MKITEKDVEHLANMSRLDVTEEDKAAYIQFLHAGLDYLEQMRGLDTSAVEPAGHVLPIQNVFREDELEIGLDRESALANAPEVEDGSFKVPRIV